MYYPKTHCVATPSCGAQPMDTYQAAFDNTLNQFDWNLLNRTNLATVQATNDTETMEKILYSFADSKFGPVERQFLPFPLSAKLYHALQLGVDYLMRRHTKLQRQLAEKDKQIEYLTHKLQKSFDRLDKMPRTSQCDVTVVHSCPVCQRAFKALLFLDKHMLKYHPKEVDAWKALREGQPYGVTKAFEELHQDIDHLRACITRQGYEERRKIRRNDPNVDKMPGPRKKKQPQPQQGFDPSGRVVETTQVKPMAYRRNFVVNTKDLRREPPPKDEDSSHCSYPSSVSLSE